MSFFSFAIQYSCGQSKTGLHDRRPNNEIPFSRYLLKDKALRVLHLVIAQFVGIMRSGFPYNFETEGVDKAVGVD